MKLFEFLFSNFDSSMGFSFSGVCFVSFFGAKSLFTLEGNFKVDLLVVAIDDDVVGFLRVDDLTELLVIEEVALAKVDCLCDVKELSFEFGTGYLFSFDIRVEAVVDIFLG